MKCAAFTLLLLAAACEVPTSVDRHEPAMARIGAYIEIPLKVTGSFSWIVDQSPAALAQCAPRPGLAVGSGGGTASHLGRFEAVTLDHCSIDLSMVPPITGGQGVFEWEAADGSRLAGIYAFFVGPSPASSFITLTILSGTDRFEGAAGSLSADMDRSGMLQCSDPLCLGPSTLEPLYFEGSIRLPRP